MLGLPKKKRVWCLFIEPNKKEDTHLYSNYVEVHPNMFGNKFESFEPKQKG